jgi:hypothetical protein
MRGPGLRLNLPLAIGIAIGALGVTSAARAADTDSYGTVTTVPVPAHAITCNFGAGDTSQFTFDISLVDAALGEYLLAESSHGRVDPNNTQGGLLSGATDGDILVIDTDNPGKGPSYILPPRDDPFAGRRCDDNTNFGGVPTPPSRNEISGPNGALTVNDTEVWVGDGPGRFNPGQTNSATDYKNDPCDSSVRVFSLLTRRQIEHINVHGCFRTDEGAFDPVDQVVLIANPSEQPSVAAIDPHARPVDHSPFITLISAQDIGVGDDDDDGGFGHWGDDNHGHHHHHAILKQINFDGKNGTIDATGVGIEQAVYDRQTGLFYVAIPGQSPSDTSDGYLAVVDPRPGHLNVVNNIPLTGCAPSGNALGPNETLILGCGDQVYDIKTGTLTVIPGPIGVACDEVAYDAGSGHFGSACITTTSKGKFDLLVVDAHTATTTPATSFDTELAGAPGAHSVAADPVTATFWFPAFSPPSPAPPSVCGSGQACVAVFGGDDSDAQGN